MFLNSASLSLSLSLRRERAIRSQYIFIFLYKYIYLYIHICVFDCIFFSSYKKARVVNIFPSVLLFTIHLPTQIEEETKHFLFSLFAFSFLIAVLLIVYSQAFRHNTFFLLLLTSLPLQQIRCDTLHGVWPGNQQESISCTDKKENKQLRRKRHLAGRPPLRPFNFFQT